MYIILECHHRAKNLEIDALVFHFAVVCSAVVFQRYGLHDFAYRSEMVDDPLVKKPSRVINDGEVEIRKFVILWVYNIVKRV